MHCASHHLMEKGKVMKNKGEKRASGYRWCSMKLVGMLIVMGMREARGEGGEILSPSN